MAVPRLIERYVRALVAVAEDNGLLIKDICCATAVSLSAIEPGSTAITPEEFGRLNRAIKVALDDEFCGFTESKCRCGTLPFVCETIIHEDTLGSALSKAFRFYALTSKDIRLSLTYDECTAIVSVSLTRPDLDKLHYLTEWWQLTWIHLSSKLIGEEIPVTLVQFAHSAQVDVEEYTEAFGAPCRFTQGVSQFQFPANYLARRVVFNLDGIRKLFSVEYMDLVSDHGGHRCWKTLIKTKMKECLLRSEALLTIEDLANEFDISSQTLRRRLEKNGITFRSLKDEIRREVVLKWLAQPDIPIGEVSLRAGFAERNGLVRAVRNWVGISPREYREMMTAEALHAN
jgi:AraC-like DNA-binding protein